MASMVFQLHVTLRDVEPVVWRRFLVRNTTTLATLHAILQHVMGWQNYHLWAFTIGSRRYGPSGVGAPDGDATKVRLKDLSLAVADTFEYEYDFGDGWRHDIVVEDQPAAEPRQAYPVCTGGARACPPEDCGGPRRYVETLKTIQHPDVFDVRATNRILMLAFGARRIPRNR